MDRNDKILTGALALALTIIVLCAYAPNIAPNDSVAGRLWSVANSTIFIAVISTFVAGFAGTWGAQLLAERSAHKKLLLDEIRGVKIALGLAFNVANTYLGAKKQHTRSLHEGYVLQCAAREDHLRKVQQRLIASRFEYEPDLQLIMPPVSPIDELKQVLIAQVSSIRTHLLVTPLMQSAEGFSVLLKARNNWIEKWMAVGSRNADDERRFADQYFGLRTPDGRLDQAYPSYVEGLFRSNDDCVGFAIELIEVLFQYGTELSKKYGQGAPEVKKPDFSPAKEAGLLPDATMYANWAKDVRSDGKNKNVA